MNPLVDLILLRFPYGSEAVCIFMAIQGSMAVRNGPNKNNQMNWFHAFVKSTLTAYAGATFTNIFMGRPTKMFSDDVFFGSCLIGYGIVNWLPFDIGYLFFNTLIGQLLHTVFSQIFRVGGVQGFSDAAYNQFKDSPSKYYPIPVFGPILFPVALGNMGGFLWGGFDGYLAKGMPWMFQQGISCSAFYHFYTHDKEGYVGVTLRSLVKPVAVQFMTVMGADKEESEDDVLFAQFSVGLFMVIMAIVRMPSFFGPKFSPFNTVVGMVLDLFSGKKKKVDVKPKKNKNKQKKQ